MDCGGKCLVFRFYRTYPACGLQLLFTEDHDDWSISKVGEVQC